MPGSPSAASAAGRILIPALLGVAALGANARAFDVYDAAVAHARRSADDLQRDSLTTCTGWRPRARGRRSIRMPPSTRSPAS